MHALLKDRGMDLLISCLVCSLENESTEHALLCCAIARLIWRMVRSQTWEEVKDPWLGPFLDKLHQSLAEVASQFVYIVYQIWLFRNSLVFETKITRMHQVLERAICMVAKYHSSTLLAHPLRPWNPGTLMLPWQRTEGYFYF